MKKTSHRITLSPICIVVFALLSVVLCGQELAKKEEMDPLPHEKVSTDSLMKHIIELSSEPYEGRLAGTRGHEKAMAYVERVMRSYGLKNVAIQQFPIECNKIENAKYNIYTPGSKEKRVFTLGNEFCCAGMTGRGYVDAQMVFVGYGVSHNVYDEYKDIDAKGKIVVVLSGLPSWLPASVGDNFASLRDKARVAERHGAIGLLSVNISPSCLDYEPQDRVYCGPLPHMGTFPMLQLTFDCGREIFTTEKMPIDSAIAAINADQKPHSFSLIKHAEADINAHYRADAPTYNIMGMIEGTDRIMKSEIVVLGASLDGTGQQGETCLFPGADINASGVAAVLESARLLTSTPYRPKRSILFVLFSGGEQQWLGSREFLLQYGKLKHVEAFVNVQNIGSGDSIMLLGDNRYPTLWNLAMSHDTIARRHHVVRNVEPSNPKGDARAFDMMRIPSVVITTWKGLQHNHTTTDVWENINPVILTRAARLVMETVADLADGRYQGRTPQSKGYRYGLITY